LRAPAPRRVPEGARKVRPYETSEG
jgi:hypothetical protein